MKVLLSWLREFAPIDGDPVELGAAMSMLGMAVESMEVFESLDGVIVAEVMSTRPHPDADRIQLVDVDTGDGRPLQICCGAFNMAVGDRIPLATIGTTMPNGMEIAKRKMRGEESNGMLCSAAELGLGDDHAGIYILPNTVQVGARLTSELGLDGDVLYDLEINPNRPDAMSVAGVARDLAAHLGVPFSIPEWSVSGSEENVADVASVTIHDPQLCGRFAARVLRGVTVGQSPAWMQLRLALCGMRPINSVVDVSNYVMLELGTPNHTYDLAKVPNGHLGVRRAREGEQLVTLDDNQRALTSSDGVIVDANDAAIGIAGVMGGASTEISETTTDVLLELAWWWPRPIAETSTRLGLRSEASQRFERGTDWGLNLVAVDRFCSLMVDQGASVVGGYIDVRGDLPPVPVVDIRTSRVNHVLGTELTGDDVERLLVPIGFAVERDGDVLRTTVPSFRPDTETETDVIEEIARHHGYGVIPRTVPRSPDAGHLTPYQTQRRALRHALTGAGFNEIIPSPFLAPGDVSKSGLHIENPVSLLNPLAAEESVLRPSLLPGALGVIAYNESHRNQGMRAFEIGHTFLPPRGDDVLPVETEWLAVAVAGSDAPAATAGWRIIAESVGVSGIDIINTDDIPGMHPTRAARLVAGDQVIGHLGEVDPGVLAAWNVSERVAWVEVDLGALLALPEADAAYVQVSTQPSSDIDLAFVVPDAIQASAVQATIVEAGMPELVDIALFDVFRGGRLETDTRSLAYTLRLQSRDHTLTDEEIGAIRARCIDAVRTAHGVELRA